MPNNDNYNWVSNLSPEDLAKLKDLMNNRPPSIPYEPPVMPPTYVQPHGPCPSCGHCPTCGRRGSSSWFGKGRALLTP